MSNTSCNVPTIALVHGTFAARTKWATESLLAREFRKSLLRFNVITPVWTGHNSPESRAEAADSLAQELKAEIARQPGPLLIVGHSHGGVAAVSALQDEELARHVTGVVTLGTPFITFEPRQKSVLSAVRHFVYLLVAFLITEACRFLLRLEHSGVFILLMGLPIFYLLEYLEQTERVRNFLRRAKLNAFDKFAYPRSSVPLLAIQDTSDEAFGLLSMISLSTRLPLGVAGLFETVVVRMAVPLLAFSACVVFPVMLWNQSFTLDLTFLGEFGEIAGLTVVSCIAALLVCSIGLIVASNLLSLFLLATVQGSGAGFGRTVFGTYLMGNVRVERVPPGMTNVELRLIQVLSRSLGFRHCQFYNDGRCVRVVRDWVNEQMATWEPGAPDDSTDVHMSQRDGLDSAEGSGRPTETQYRLLQTICRQLVTLFPAYQVTRSSNGCVVIERSDDRLQFEESDILQRFLYDLIDVDLARSPVRVTSAVDRLIWKYQNLDLTEEEIHERARRALEELRKRRSSDSEPDSLS